MPLYRFVCTTCQAEEKKLMKEADLEGFAGGCKLCGGVVRQTLGTTESRSMETVDEYRGKASVQGIDKMIEDRAKDHDRKKNFKSV